MSDTKYHCTGGNSYDQMMACPLGCHTWPGQNDECCADNAVHCEGMQNGRYCGNDGICGQANFLYECSGGSVAWSRQCSSASGCALSGPGTNDDCAKNP